MINVVLKFSEKDLSLSQLNTIQGFIHNFTYEGVLYDIYEYFRDSNTELYIDSVKEVDAEFVAANLVICLQSIGVKDIEVSYEETVEND